MIGGLTQRITWQQATRTTDGAGGATVAWSDTAKLWAEVLPTGGREATLAGVPAGSQAWKVTIHWRKVAPTHLDRLVYGTRRLDVRADFLDPDGKRERLVGFCESGAMIP